jgi:TusA-related sulfurtransferase
MELIRAIREGQVGDAIAVYSSDAGSKMDIPKWVEKAGHRLVGIEARDGYDEIVVEKLR